MRHAVAVVLAAILPSTAVSKAASQPVTVRVDPRIELLAVVNRLAGRSEYNLTRVPRWAAAVDSHFAPFRDHPAVAMTRRLRFGFFIPMNLAIHVTMPPQLAERAPFAASASLHRRWTALPDSTSAYLALLRGFAIESRFAALLDAQRPLADSAAARLRRVADGIDHAWIERFWGDATGATLVLAAGLTNGAASYGQEYDPPAGAPETWAIVGVARADAAGLPLFDADDAPTVLHEMNHPYVTPLIRANADALRPAAESLYATVADRMREQAYGSWDAMLNESLVRAAVPRYYLARGDRALAERTIAEEVEHGFVWTRELVELMGEYERDRTAYPTMRAFMPRIAAFFRDRARRS